MRSLGLLRRARAAVGSRLLAVPLVALPLVPMWCDRAGVADVNYPLLHEFSLQPGFGQGLVTSCYKAPTDVPGREWMCRVIEGYEELGAGHMHTYELFGPLAGRQNPDPILSVSSRPGYGRTVVLDGGVVFEGCTWYSPSNSYKCDYKATRFAVLSTDNSATTYVLRKFFDWAHYVGNTLGCAGGIAAVWRGGRITLPLLAGCADGPL